MRKKSLLAMVPLSPTTLWRLIQAGQFPSPIQLSDSGRCPAWRLGDVRHWLAARQAA
ncbi:helix-turn-helix transcriptional regulator [Piscinibacterium candidicorallinum]|uniref:Helix-turn-helix transcriptional regulator n=1 Tax=Piscinibacterium candidicorallinum TaxID=1793872 RepID=A0ABV7H4A5_9BURK